MRLSTEESLDVFGQVSFIMLENLSKLKSSEKLIGYVSMVTRREILRSIRRKKLFDKIDPELTKSISVTKFKSPEELLESSKKIEILMQAIVELPEKEYKLIWHLFLDKDSPSYEQIAATLNIPVASIGPTRIRSLKKLQKILKKMGYK